MAHGACPKADGPGAAGCSAGPVPPLNSLREDWRWRRLILLRQANLGRLAVVPLEGQVRRPHAELALRYLLEVVVAGLDAELHLVEGIGEANSNAHVVAIELLAKSDVRHLEGGELPLLDLHRSAVEIIRLENHRRTQLGRGVEASRPGNRVGAQRRLRSAISDHLEDVEAGKCVQLGAETQVAIEV